MVRPRVSRVACVSRGSPRCLFTGTETIVTRSSRLNDAQCTKYFVIASQTYVLDERVTEPCPRASQAFPFASDFFFLLFLRLWVPVAVLATDPKLSLEPARSR